MFTRRTPDGQMAGYCHESIGEALMQLLELKTNNRKTYKTQLIQDPSDINGFYATLMAQAAHVSLERGRKSPNGEIYIGDTVKLNDYLIERLAENASDYIIKSDI